MTPAQVVGKRRVEAIAGGTLQWAGVPILPARTRHGGQWAGSQVPSLAPADASADEPAGGGRGSPGRLAPEGGRGTGRRWPGRARKPHQALVPAARRAARVEAAARTVVDGAGAAGWARMELGARLRRRHSGARPERIRRRRCGRGRPLAAAAGGAAAEPRARQTPAMSRGGTRHAGRRCAAPARGARPLRPCPQ